MRKINKILFIIAFFIIIITIANTVSAIDTGKYTGIYDNPNSTKIDSYGSKIMGVVQVVAAVVAVSMVVVIGIKYIMASPNDKADLKNEVILVVIGAVLIFGGANVLTWVVSSFNSALG